MTTFSSLESLSGGALLSALPAWLQGYGTPQRLAIPAAGALCAVTLAGSSTPVDVFPNPDGSGTPLTQPFAADADGRLPGYVAQPAMLDLAISGTGIVARRVRVGYPDVAGVSVDGETTRAETAEALLAAMNGCRLYVPAGADTGAHTTTGNCVTHDASGRILIGGEVAIGGVTKAAVLRLNADGSVDTTFGTNGWWTFVPTGGGCIVQGIAVQADGKIVLGAGNIGPGGEQAMCCRINTDGTPDTSFGTGGAVLWFPTGTSSALGFAVGVQSDGKVVVGGSVIRISDGVKCMFATRLNTDGTIDTGYGSSGSSVFSPDNAGGGAVWGMKIDSQNRAWLGGQAKKSVSTTTQGTNAAGQTTTVAGVIAGYVDVASTAGMFANISTKIGADSTTYSVVAVLSGTRLQISPPLASSHANGDAVVQTTDTSAIARLTSAGALDTSFAGVGYRSDTFGLDSAGLAIALQVDGKAIMAAGAYVDAPSFVGAVTLSRYNPDGSLDASYGQGLQYSPGGWAYVLGPGVNGMDIQPDGKVVLANNPGGSHVWCSRVAPDGMLDFGFGARGSVPSPLQPKYWMTGNGIVVMPVIAGQTLADVVMAGTGVHPLTGQWCFAAVVMTGTGKVRSAASPTLSQIPPSVPVLPANGLVASPSPPSATDTSVTAGSASPRLAALTGDGAKTQFTIWHGMAANPVRARGFAALGAGIFGPEVELNYGASPLSPTNAVTVVFPLAPAAGDSYYVELEY